MTALFSATFLDNLKFSPDIYQQWHDSPHITHSAMNFHLLYLSFEYLNFLSLSGYVRLQTHPSYQLRIEQMSLIHPQSTLKIFYLDEYFWFLGFDPFCFSKTTEHVNQIKNMITIFPKF